MAGNYSIVDVAREAGVGIGTVSRVLNNAPNVHPSTAAQVHAAVAKLGYRLPARGNRRGPRPKSQGSSARQGKEILMAVMGPQGLDWIFQCAPVFVGVLHGVEEAAAEKGHVLTIRQAANWNQLADSISGSPPAGLIVLGFETGIGSRGQLSSAFQQIPTVWTMGSPVEYRGDHVQPDHIKIGTIAAGHCLKHGLINCAAIGTQFGSPAFLVGFRNDSFLWTIRQQGGEANMLLSPDLVRIGTAVHEVNLSVVRNLVQTALASPRRPQALFLESDILAPAVYQELVSAGVRPQQDIEIVTCNNERPYLAPLQPKPTIIDIQPQIIGHRAVDQLIWRAANRNTPALRIMVEPVLIPSEGK